MDEIHLPTSFAVWIPPLILAILGTAAYEWLIKPSIRWSGRKLLGMISFGRERAKRNIYTRISLGRRNWIAQFSTYYLLVVLTIAGVSAVQLHFNQLNEVERLQVTIDAQQTRNADPISPEAMFDENARSLQQLERSIVRALISSVALLLIFGAILWFQFIAAVYIESAVAHFEALYQAARPLLEDRVAARIRADFAAVRTADNFEAVLSQLTTALDSAGIEHTQFRYWGL